jgi:hypothetical protein
MGKRTPPVLHVKQVPATDDDRRHFRWPKDEAAAMYEVGVDANESDCQHVPRVSLSTKDVKIRGVMWSPKVGCEPPGSRTTH